MSSASSANVPLYCSTVSLWIIFFIANDYSYRQSLRLIYCIDVDVSQRKTCPLGYPVQNPWTEIEGKVAAIVLMESVVSSVISITDAEFDTEVLKAEQPVLVYFWASWCGPCRLVSPSVNWIADTYSDRLKVFKMEIDPNPATVKKYRVEGVPAIFLFKDGEVAQSHEGAIGKQKLESMLETHLSPVS